MFRVVLGLVYTRSMVDELEEDWKDLRHETPAESEASKREVSSLSKRPVAHPKA